MEGINSRTIGVNLSKEGKATVRFWCPGCTKVEIQVNQARRIPLEKEEYGWWHLQTDQLKPGDQYKFILDDRHYIPDPASLSQPDVHGPSVAEDLHAFAWTDQSWNNIPQEQYILYELHTAAFTEEGTFSGIEKKLPHLKSLGITAIELMPVAQFPGKYNWGYDGVYPFAVQHSYGGLRGLQQLVDSCHAQGIAVVLDVVYNHFGPEGNYISGHAPYLTDKYKTPWGEAMNFDDAYCDGVRDFFIQSALMYFRDFHIDALRLDATHAIKDLSAKHFLQELREKTDALMKLTGKSYYLFIENDLNDPRYIRSSAQYGYGMDAQWIDEFHHALRVASGQERTGYYADFNGIAHLAKAYRDAYVYDNMYSPHRKKIFGGKARELAARQFIVFSQNHDQTGNRMLGERTGTLVSFEMLKLMAGAVMVSPFLPLLFMGEEYGETNPFLYFTNHSDPEVKEAVKKGRKEEFREFHAAGEAPDPNDIHTFNRSKLQWDLLNDTRHRALFDYYRTLIALRKHHPVLSRSSRELETAVNPEHNTLVLTRSHQEQTACCLMNFSKHVRYLSLPAHSIKWTKILDSAGPQWYGPTAVPPVQADGIPVQPESIMIYAN